MERHAILNEYDALSFRSETFADDYAHFRFDASNLVHVRAHHVASIRLNSHLLRCETWHWGISDENS